MSQKQLIQSRDNCHYACAREDCADDLEPLVRDLLALVTQGDAPRLRWDVDESDGAHLVHLDGFPNMAITADGVTREEALHKLGDILTHAFMAACTEPEVHREQTQGGWRPIASAPKDGTDMLLTDGQYRRVGYWAKRINAWSIDFAGGGLNMPTHWVPIPPDPPAPGAEERGAGRTDQHEQKEHD